MNSGTVTFIDSLRDACARRKSGILFISVPPNHQARIGVATGTIVHLAINTQRGEAAIAALATATVKSFKFETGVVPPTQAGLPETDLLLDRLEGLDAEAESADEDALVQAQDEISVDAEGFVDLSIAPSQVVAAPALGQENTASAAPHRLDEQTLAIVTEELKDFLGPIAVDLVRERAAAPSVGLLLNQLSVHFGTLAEAMRLRQRVERRLGPEMFARRTSMVRGALPHSAAA